MYTIAGATGRVGSAAAQQLLADGAEVRVLVRDPAAGEEWSRRGADVAVTHLSDRAGLTAALEGSSGLFAMMPFNLQSADVYADAREWAGTLAGAVSDSGVPHVAALSSVGADLTEGTGLVLTLHDLEVHLRATGAVVSAIRSNHFQENVADVLDAAREGVYPVLGDTADSKKTMIATRDVGAIVAQALQEPPAAHEVIDVDGPAYTEREVADKLGALLDTQLKVVTIPQPGWIAALTETGLSPHVVGVLSEMYDADQRGLLQPRGDRTVRGTTEIDSMLAALLV